MAKNPIFPLYYNDIDRSTRDWTDEEFGAYVRLLVHQWDKGHLPNDYQRLTRIATSLATTWSMLKDKFPENGVGLKNPVLEDIRTKTLKHREKQKNNVLNRYQNATKKLPLEDEYEKENEIKDITVRDSSIVDNWISIKNKWNGDFRWKEKICRDKNIQMPELEIQLKEFITDIELKEDYKSIQGLKSHFINWYNKHKNGSTTHKQPAASAKLGTSEARTEALRKW